MDVVTLALSKQYTKEQINNLLSVGFMPVVVDTLPEVSAADSNKIYLVPSEKAEGDNNYLEYLAIEGAWECIGSTAINFEEYAKITDVDAKINAQGVYSLNASRIAEMKTKVGAPSATYINIAMIYMAYGCGVYKLDENSVTFKMTSSNQRTLGKGTIIIISGGTKFCWIISGGTSGPQMDFFYNSSSSAPTSYTTYPDKWTYTTLSETWVKKLATISSLVSEADVKALIMNTKGYTTTGASFSGSANNLIGGNGQFFSWSGGNGYYFNYLNSAWKSYTIYTLDGATVSLSSAGAFGNGYFLIKTSNTTAEGIGFIYSHNAAGNGDYNKPGMWSTIALPKNLEGLSFTKMYYANNRFYLFNTSGKGAFSEDGGHTWELIELPSVSPTGFTYGNGIYIMTTTGSQILRSEDGITWESISSSVYMAGIAFFKDVFILPYGGVLYYTVDGKSFAKWNSTKSYYDGPICEGIESFAWAMCGTATNSNNTSSSYVMDDVIVYKHGDYSGNFDLIIGDTGKCRALVFNGKDYGVLRGSFYVGMGEFSRADIKNNYQDHLKYEAEFKKVDKKIENAVNEGITSKITIFNGDEDEYLTLTQEQKNNYLIAIVNPLAVLNEEEVSVLNDILLDSEPTTTIMNLTDEEIEAELDIIINGVAPIEEEV